MNESGSLTALERLYRAGDPCETWQWEKGDPDYVAQFGIGPEHIPELVEIARQWINNNDRPEDELLYAPIHAWRGLAQLHAVEAVEPLLAMQNQLDKEGDGWYLEEFHDVFGWIGPSAIPALKTYLADTENGKYPRISTCHGLCEIAKRYPESRMDVIQIITDQLAKHEPAVYSLNGFLIAYLLDLKAVESAETIERAYAAEVVDEIVCGDWAKVREELGVPGLGLAPDRPRKSLFVPRYGFPPPSYFDDKGTSELDRRRRKMVQKQEKAERKRRKMAKKRNRN